MPAVSSQLIHCNMIDSLSLSTASWLSAPFIDHRTCFTDMTLNKGSRHLVNFRLNPNCGFVVGPNSLPHMRAGPHNPQRCNVIKTSSHLQHWMMCCQHMLQCMRSRHQAKTYIYRDTGYNMFTLLLSELCLFWGPNISTWVRT